MSEWKRRNIHGMESYVRVYVERTVWSDEQMEFRRKSEFRNRSTRRAVNASSKSWKIERDWVQSMSSGGGGGTNEEKQIYGMPRYMPISVELHFLDPIAH